MVALTMLAVVWTLNRRSARGLVAAALAASLTIASYPTMKLFVPLLLCAAAAIYWRTLRDLDREALGCGARPRLPRDRESDLRFCP